MSKRRLNNLLKRNFSVLEKSLSQKAMGVIKKGGDEFIKSQLREISRFGGNLIVMQMGS